ncbi:hypothetical protein WMF39_15215 [Sorangium sp. So ce1504]
MAKYLGEHDLDEIVDDLPLVSDMLVEGHGLGVQALADSPHRHGVEAGLIGEAKHRPKHPIPRQSDARVGPTATLLRIHPSIDRALRGVRGERSRELDPSLLGMPP